MKVEYRCDVSRMLGRLAEVRRVSEAGMRGLTLEYAKRAASKAIRTTPPNSVKNGGNGKKVLEEHIARDIGGDPLEGDVRVRRGEAGELGVYAYPRKRRGGVLVGVRGRRFKGVDMVSADVFLRSHTVLRLGRKSAVRVLKGGGLARAGVASIGDVKRAISERKRHVGRMAAGWLKGARLAGLKKVPGWVARHAGYYDGEGHLVIGRGGRVHFEMENVPEYPDRGQLGRVAAYALGSAGRDMRRVIRGYVRSLKNGISGV